MTKLKYAVDSKYTNPWIERVGKLILNFSAIEMESIHWLVQLTEREFEISSLANAKFSSRTNQIMRLIEARKLDEKWRKQSLKRWNEALKLAQLRNQVAHNPLLFGWNHASEVGEPDILGMPNIGARKSSKATWLLSKDYADQSINSMVDIAQALAELRCQWCSERDQGQVPPVGNPPNLWRRMRRRIDIAVYAFKGRNA